MVRLVHADHFRSRQFGVFRQFADRVERFRRNRRRRHFHFRPELHHFRRIVFGIKIAQHDRSRIGCFQTVHVHRLAAPFDKDFFQRQRQIHHLITTGRPPPGRSHFPEIIPRQVRGQFETDQAFAVKVEYAGIRRIVVVPGPFGPRADPFFALCVTQDIDHPAPVGSGGRLQGQVFRLTRYDERFFRMQRGIIRHGAAVDLLRRQRHRQPVRSLIQFHADRKTPNGFRE